MPDVTITVDGKTISCPPGELVIEAAKRAGIYIPHFCWHPRMDPIGACRMCLVHMEPGPPKPQTACTTRVSDGMVIRTQFTDDKIKDAQEGVLEFLLINHPLDCPICDRAGECPLQDQTQDYGPDETRYVEPKRRFAKPVPISSLINLDRERCILCYRCTRFCEELSGDQLIGTMQRGPRAYIFPFEGESFDSVFSGNTVQICPVGALTSTPYRFQARPWDLRLTASTCNLCASGCNVNLNVRVADGKLVRVGSRVNEAVNEEWLCDKGRYGHAYVSSPDRLAQPWVRRDGELQPVSWDEALTVLTERIGPLLSDRQTDRVGLLLGGSLTDEDAYTAQKFARMVLRTNSVDHRLDGGMAASALMPPALTYDDLLSADHVVVVSADLREELPLVFLRLRIAAARKKLRLSLVHPRRVAGIEFASAHLAPLPGSEAAVASGLAAAMGKPLAAGVEAMAASAGVSTSELLSFAEALGSGGTVILLGPAVAADPAALGAWNAIANACGARVGWAPRRAGEYGALAAGAHPELLPGWRPVADPALRSEVESAWGGPVPEQPGEDTAAVLSRARSGGLDLLWLVGADVLGDVPDARLGAEALVGAGYVVVQDVQSSDLVEFADLLLPAAAFAERDGTLTDWEGRRQPIQAGVDPPGSARADYAILSECARRLGRPIGCRRLGDVQEELSGLLDRPASAVPAPGVVSIPDPPVTRDGFPLRLLTYRLLYDAGSRVRRTEEIATLTQQPYAEMHPDDAAIAGVQDGAMAIVTSRHGRLSVPVRVSDTVRPGVVFVPYAQPGAPAQNLLTVGDRSPAVRVEPL